MAWSGICATKAKPPLGKAMSAETFLEGVKHESFFFFEKNEKSMKNTEVNQTKGWSASCHQQAAAFHPIYILTEHKHFNS